MTLGVRPGDLRIADGGLPAVVERIEDLGDSTIVNLLVDGRLVKLKTDEASRVREGETVFVALRAGRRASVRPATGARVA